MPTQVWQKSIHLCHVGLDYTQTQEGLLETQAPGEQRPHVLEKQFCVMGRDGWSTVHGLALYFAKRNFLVMRASFGWPQRATIGRSSEGSASGQGGCPGPGDFDSTQEDSSTPSGENAAERGRTFQSRSGSGLSKTFLQFPEKLTA